MFLTLTCTVPHKHGTVETKRNSRNRPILEISNLDATCGTTRNSSEQKMAFFYLLLFHLRTKFDVVGKVNNYAFARYKKISCDVNVLYVRVVANYGHSRPKSQTFGQRLLKFRHYRFT